MPGHEGRGRRGGREAPRPAAIALKADVSNRADVERAAHVAIDAFGRVDIVVNNAGTTHRNKPLMEVEEAEFDRIFAVNVKSILLTAQAFIPHMRAHGGGVFINIGSTAALRPRPGLTAYNASKGAVHLMTKSMAVELAPDKIRVCALAPVAGETPLLAMFMGEDTPEKRAAFKATVPLGRFSTPEDIGLAALFLASDEANFLTGVVLEVDGGRCIERRGGREGAYLRPLGAARRPSPRDRRFGPSRRTSINDLPDRGSILAFAVGKVLELTNDRGPVTAGPSQVRVDSTRLGPSPNVRSRTQRPVVAFRNHDPAAPELKLSAVGADLQSNLKAEGFLEPFSAVATSGYSRTGMIAHAGMERFDRIQTISHSVDSVATPAA